jgi:hypothetical protein
MQTVKHLTTIKNTKSSEVHITMLEQLPLSNDKQIQVQLLKPTHRVRSNYVMLVSCADEGRLAYLRNFFLCQDGDNNTTLTAANHLMWRLRIAPGQQIQLPFKYQLEWPQNTDINL